MEQPGEKETIQKVAEQFNRLQMMNFNEHHHCLRGTHLKTQGVCYGTDITYYPRPSSSASAPLAALRLTDRPLNGSFSASWANSSFTTTSRHTLRKACSPNRAPTT